MLELFTIQDYLISTSELFQRPILFWFNDTPAASSYQKIGKQLSSATSNTSSDLYDSIDGEYLLDPKMCQYSTILMILQVPNL